MISGLKSVINAVATLIIFPLYMTYWLMSCIACKNSVFASFSQFLSLFPGKAGSYLRNNFYRMVLTKCDSGIVFSFGTLLSQVDTEVASGTYIGPQCNIGSCKIGPDCLLGSGVHILSGSRQHAFDDLQTPIRDQGGTISKISIGRDCWIGNGAIIMADVGDQCIVAAGAVVTKPVPSRTIVAGHPAKVVKQRG